MSAVDATVSRGAIQEHMSRNEELLHCKQIRTAKHQTC